MVVYQKNGIEYPVYCLNRDTQGITTERSYSVTANEEIQNNLVWRAIINGYPYKTIQELDCLSVQEAYVATKMAVYDMLYNYDYNDFSPVGEAGTRVFNAMKNIANTARNSNQIKETASIKINEEDIEWKVEGEYIIKNYSIDSPLIAQTYKVEISDNSFKNIKITDKNNVEKEEFNLGEGFKIKIPILECVEDGSFCINVSSNQKTNPVIHGIAPSVDLQDYALTTDKYEKAVASIKEEYKKNNTKIKIIKVDGETLTALSNVEFSLFDKNKKEVENRLITDEKGEVVIENILPGTYFLSEIKEIEGYENNDNLYEITVDFNEEKEIVINNFKKKKIEEKIQIQENNENDIKQEVKLPRTGR